jgi:hypothetical protein
MDVEEISEIVLENVRRVKAAFNDVYPTVHASVKVPVTFYV